MFSDILGIWKRLIKYSEILFVRECFMLKLSRKIVRPSQPENAYIVSSDQLFLLCFLGYQQSLFFLSPSSEMRETQNWPRAWLKARAWTPLTKSEERLERLHAPVVPFPSLKESTLSLLYEKYQTTVCYKWKQNSEVLLKMLNLIFRATGFIMMLSLNSNVVANLFCKHVTEFAGVMLGSKLLVKIAYPARNPVGRIVPSWHAYMRRD